jgi:polysaccharide chain length determinant protein (PEP-CTERM system associated)
MYDEQQETSEPIELSEIKGIIRRNRWPFLILLFLGWLVVWGVSWALPSIYRSGTLILVEQPAVPEKFVVSNIDIDIQQQLDSITQQILSRTRLLTIIDHLNLYAADRKHVSDDMLVGKMQKDIQIELVRGDDRKLSAFNIYYAGRDPDLVQRTTSELANLFITENLEQRQERSENTTKFLQEQLDQARQALATQEERVRAFKDKHIGELPSQTAANMQILAGLQADLQTQRDALSRAKQQNTYLESLLSQYRALGPTASGKGGEAPAGGIADIDRELERLKAELADLSSHYTDKHPDVRKKKQQIARLEKIREKLLADLNTKPDNPDESKTPAILEMESQLKANRAEIANHEASIRDLQGRVTEYQGRLNMAPVMEQQFADITRDYEQSKTDYDSLLAKKNQSEMATNLEKTQQGEHFRMLDPPNRPTRPYKPNRLQLCGAGLAVGLVFGAAVSLAREKLSGRLFTEREIKKLVPFAVMAEIPPIETEQEQVAERRGRWILAIAAVVIAGAILTGSAVSYLYG